MIEQRQRIVAVEDASEEFWGAPLPPEPQTRLGHELRAAAHSFIETQRKRGEEYIESGGVHVYGPLDTMTDVEALLTGYIDDEHYHRVVDAGQGWGYYVLNMDVYVTGAPVLEGATT